jgi:hypothetical protein
VDDSGTSLTLVYPSQVLVFPIASDVACPKLESVSVVGAGADAAALDPPPNPKKLLNPDSPTDLVVLEGADADADDDDEPDPDDKSLSSFSKLSNSPKSILILFPPPEVDDDFLLLFMRNSIPPPKFTPPDPDPDADAEDSVKSSFKFKEIGSKLSNPKSITSIL